MQANGRNFFSQQIAFPIFIAIIVAVVAALPVSWNEAVKDVSGDLQFKLRGSRDLSDEFVFVYIGAEDIQAMGGWPITRDYYGYMTYALQKLGAKVIAFDILLEKPAQPYREYDEMLGNLFSAAGNVCLPMTFSELSAAQRTGNQQLEKLRTGKNPLFPLAILRERAAATGFSNLGEGGVIRKVPVAVYSENGITFSFGAEIARFYLNGKESLEIATRGLRFPDAEGNSFSIPLDDQGRLRLNHFGSMENASRIGFVELLQQFDENPDSLNFSGKIVLIAATSPGLPVLRATPFSDVFPASLIHATAAENIFQQNYLRELPRYGEWLIILLMAFLAIFAWQIKNRVAMLITAIAAWLVYFALAMLFFSAGNLMFPLFYPALAYLAAHAYLFFFKQKEREGEEQSRKQLLNEQMRKKEAELRTAKSGLEELQTELSNKEADSQQYRELAEERQNAIRQLESELRDLQGYILPEKQPSPEAFPGIICSPESKMKEVLELIERIRSADIPVLIEGETGTGKEIIARAIHQGGPRKNKAFVAVNCGALPETLLESELFGHEKGSFTGAQSQRRGRFEIADSGSIFLDEITETSPAFQARLLRVLQEGTFERVGGEKTLHVNVRVIAACNRNLQGEMDKGNFRPDLFYRLNGFPIKLPPLRERKEDIPLLIAHFLEKHADPFVTRLSDQAMALLQNYRWPGNVRELENAIRRAAIMARGESREIIRSSDLPPEILQTAGSPASEEIYKPLEAQILEMLRSFQFSHTAISRTAKALGNKDRGTVTEYFRGICFEAFVEADYDLEAAAKNVADSSEEAVIERVRKKMEAYLNNLYPLPETDFYGKGEPAAEADTTSFPQFKGLPKKYHSHLLSIIEHFKSRDKRNKNQD